MSYNRPFLQTLFNRNIPDFMKWEKLFNVAYCLDTEQLKLYFMADEKTFLYKCPLEGEVTRQYDAARADVDIEKLDRFLDCELNYGDLVLDTVQENIYYIYCEESGFEQTVRLLEILLDKFGISTS
ncbi:MAG: hypothetical protein ACLFQB_15920, partial [Chitinispirillaceae bacterium]